MGVVEQPHREDRFWILLFMAGLVAGLVLRFKLASYAQMPGHGDSAFYYTVAKNIVAGRGPVVDYIVYFFEGLLPLPHYAGDFWNPTASFLIAIPMLFLGKSIQSALIAPILASVVPAVAGFLAGRRYTGSVAAGALAGILTFFSAFEVWFSTTTEAIIFAGAFGSLALYLMMKGREAHRFFLLAALFTGLANLVRQDNVLLLVVLESCILLSTMVWKHKVAVALTAAAIHLVVLAPLLALNLAELHAVFPHGPSKTAYLTTYEDFHSYNKRIDWYTLRATWGIRGIVKRRLHTAEENLNQVRYFLTPLLTLLVLVAIADAILLRPKRQRLWMLFPAALFALLEYGFYSFIASFSGPGSLIKSLATLLPFISMAVVGVFARYSRSNLAMAAAVCLVAVYSAYEGYNKNLSSTLYYNGVYAQYKDVRSMILNDVKLRGDNPDKATVLARDTWDVYEGTGLKSVMVPNNDLDTIVFVAQHYGAHYILLPAKRPQLEKIYTNVTPDPRFRLLASVPESELRLYWIDFDK
jgi:hypothetical protein